MDELIKTLVTGQTQFQQSQIQLQQQYAQLAQKNDFQAQKTNTHLQLLEKQIGQSATSISKMEAQGSGKLPSQIMVNPRDNTSIVTLGIGKELEERPPASKP